jgi:hypothetical protein
MRMQMPALAVIALVGFCSHAKAQTKCPELTRLRGEAAEAAKQIAGVAGRCEAYSRFSMAWGDIFRYANDHRELCDVSGVLLGEFEKRYREAVKARDNVCAGRPLHSFPPDIIKR